MSSWEVWSTNNEVLDAVFQCLQKLRITNCPKLRSPSLKELPLLKVLRLDRCGDGVLRSLVRAASSITELSIYSIIGLTNVVWRGVLKSLGAVQNITIKECNEIRYLWESEAEASKVLGNLKDLYVYKCSSLVSLGEKEEEDNFGSNVLSSLRVLNVTFCNNMERCCLPNSIERLEIFSCDSVTSVSFPKATGGGGQKLKSLSIIQCNKLMEKITNTCMPLLEDIRISGWENLKSIIHLSNFTLLTSLYISYCPSIESFPDIQLLNLTDLTIDNCQNLNSFPNLQLLNLTSLTIESCTNLKSFPDLQMPNLTYLGISDCESMESFPDLQLMNLTLLTDLRIRDCPSIDASFPRGHWPPKLSSLVIGRLKKPISEWGPQNFPASLVNLGLRGEPDVSDFSQLSYLFPSSLIELYIIEFDKVESLSKGLEHLTSLQHLTFWECPKMKRLPKTLLPSLLSLSIDGCPSLQERCNGRGSHYWPLISHIPYIELTD